MEVQRKGRFNLQFRNEFNLCATPWRRKERAEVRLGVRGLVERCGGVGEVSKTEGRKWGEKNMGKEIKAADRVTGTTSGGRTE